MAQRNVLNLAGDTSISSGRTTIATYSLTLLPTVAPKGSLMYNTDDNTLRESDGVSWNFAVQNVPVGGVLTGSLPNPGLAANSVNTINLVNGSVTSNKLATTGVAAGTVGDSTHVAQITVNPQGQITSISSIAISGGGGGFDPANPVFYGTGTSTNNSGIGSTTIGPGAITTGGTKASAFGVNSSSTGLISTALGATTVASALGSLAVGGGDTLGASATATSTIAIGGSDGVVAGALASSNGSIAIGAGRAAGQGAVASGTNSIAVGSNNSTGVTGAANATAANAIAFGPGTLASAAGSAAFGNLANVVGTNALALGPGASILGVGAAGNLTTVVGPFSAASGDRNIIVGALSTSSGTGSAVYGVGMDNPTPNSSIFGNNNIITLRLNDPAVGNFVYFSVSSTFATATVTPTIAQLVGGVIFCSFAGAITIDLSNCTGVALDAFPWPGILNAGDTGLTFTCQIVPTGGVTAQISYTGAGLGVTATGGTIASGGTPSTITFIRTGFVTWRAWFK